MRGKSVYCSVGVCNVHLVFPVYIQKILKRHPFSLLRSVRLEDVVVVVIAGSARGLEAVDVVSPPRAGGPPEGALPDVAVLLEVVEQALDGGLALAVGASCEFADDALLAVGAEPLGGAGHALRTDGPRHTHVRRAGVVRVQVLVHLVDQLVGRVGQSLQVVVGRDPRVSARPAVALRKDVLRRRARAADRVDGCLVQVQHERLVHVVVLIVGVEDDLVVRLKGRRYGRPELAETSCVRDNGTVVTAEVVPIKTLSQLPFLIVLSQ